MFVAENPSLTQLEKVGATATYESQWSVSDGDALLREALYRHGLKRTPPQEEGGWQCYLTNVIKEADYASRFNEKNSKLQLREAERWSPVLAWQMEDVGARLLVAMGDRPLRYLRHLERNKTIRLPRVEKIWHYSYVPAYRGNRPEWRNRYFEMVGEIARSVGLHSS